MVDGATVFPGSEALQRQVRENEAALRENDVWLAAQKEAFQAAVNGSTLEASLAVLIRAAVAQLGPDARCALYIADTHGAELHHVTGMPASYAECVGGFKIAPDSLACGLISRLLVVPDRDHDRKGRGYLRDVLRVAARRHAA